MLVKVSQHRLVGELVLKLLRQVPVKFYRSPMRLGRLLRIQNERYKFFSKSVFGNLTRSSRASFLGYSVNPTLIKRIHKPLNRPDCHSTYPCHLRFRVSIIEKLQRMKPKKAFLLRCTIHRSLNFFKRRILPVQFSIWPHSLLYATKSMF